MSRYFPLSVAISRWLPNGSLCDCRHSLTLVPPNFYFSAEMSTRAFSDYFKERRSNPTSILSQIRAVTLRLLKQSDVTMKSLRHFQIQLAIVDPTFVEGFLWVAKINLPHIILSNSRLDVLLDRFSDPSLLLSYVFRSVRFISLAVNVVHQPRDH